MHRVVLGIGGNIGNRLELLRKAELLLEKKMHCVKKSGIYETEPWGGSSEGWYLNRVLVLETIMSAEEVLKFIQGIEIDLGRKRDIKWGDRSMDIDILYFDDLILKTKSLEIPHPQLAYRNFVLEPLNEVIKDHIHPVLGKTQLELWNQSQDKLKVRLIPDQ